MAAVVRVFQATTTSVVWTRLVDYYICSTCTECVATTAIKLSAVAVSLWNKLMRIDGRFYKNIVKVY